MPSYQTILFDIKGGSARLTLNRPDKLNSFNVLMHEELRAALDATAAAAESGAARVLLLTGAGRAFSAGQDLGDRAVAPGEAQVSGTRGEAALGSAPINDLGASIERYYAPLVRRLRALPLPVLCAVNGVAAGAACNLALACDLVVATESASFYQPFSKLGLVPDTGGTYFLPRLVGPARALGLALLGDKLPAAQAAAWGLIWRSVPDAAFSATVEELLRQLAAAPTRGLAATKQAMYASAANTLDQQLDLERDLQRALGATDDYREGVAAFLEKRSPRFQGR